MRLSFQRAKAPSLPTDAVSAPDVGAQISRVSKEFNLGAEERSQFQRLMSWSDCGRPPPRPDCKVRFKSSEIPLHGSWAETSLGRALKDGRLDLNLVTSDMVSELTPSQLKTLSGLLSRTEVISEVYNPRGRAMSQVELRTRKFLGLPKKINGATALVLKTLLSGDTEVMVRAVAAAPDRALPVLEHDGKARELCRGDNLIRILREMRKSGFGDEPREIKPDELSCLGTLVKLSFEAARDRDDIDLSQSVRMFFHELEDARVLNHPETLGIMAGAVVAGLAKVDERGSRLRKQAGRVTNHMWAATWMVGPFAGIASSIVVGLGDALTSTAHEEMTDLARERRNRLEAHWLQEPPPGWTFEDRVNAMAWVDLTIRSNHVHL